MINELIVGLMVLLMVCLMKNFVCMYCMVEDEKLLLLMV